jgi:hypothetical protein
MPQLSLKSLAASSAASVALIVAASVAASAQGEARRSMERCVSSVLSRLARMGAPVSEVGPVVVARCDGPLRATLAEAIRSGQAGACTVESCMNLARNRAAEEATQIYRLRTRRPDRG